MQFRSGAWGNLNVKNTTSAWSRTASHGGREIGRAHRPSLMRTFGEGDDAAAVPQPAALSQRACPRSSSPSHVAVPVTGQICARSMRSPFRNNASRNFRLPDRWITRSFGPTSTHDFRGANAAVVGWGVFILPLKSQRWLFASVMCTQLHRRGLPRLPSREALEPA